MLLGDMAWLWGLLKRLWPLWAILAVTAVVSLLLWGAVVLPQHLLDTRGLSPTQRLKAENDLRGTLVTMLAGLAVTVGGVLAALNLVSIQRLQWRAQVTERFTKAIEQLGQADDDKLDVRIGAVYALEQIARDSAELHWPIMEVLTAYLREHTLMIPDRADGLDPTAEESSEVEEARAPADVQAIATVIGRRRRRQDPAHRHLDLHGARLSHVQWSKAHLDGAYLWATQLEGADLRGARLRRATLMQARLQGASLMCAQLHGADLVQARLQGADLRWARLKYGDLSEAQLTGAYLGGAQLEGANLRRTQLERADLDGAQLNGADLDGAWLAWADLHGVDLSQAAGLTSAQLQAAKNVDATRLPPEVCEQAEPSAEAPAGPDSPHLDRSGTEG
jgi:uncharacterized protein YjbI with pentapeptide repeats